MATLTSLAAWQQCGRIGQRLPHTMTLARVLRRGAVNKDAQQRADSRWWVGGTSCCQQPMRRELRQLSSSQAKAKLQRKNPSPLISPHIHWKNTTKTTTLKHQLWFLFLSFYSSHWKQEQKKIDGRHKTSFIAASCLSSSECGIALISHQVMVLCLFCNRRNVLNTTIILTANFGF